MTGRSSATRAPRRSRPRSSSRAGRGALAAGRTSTASCASRAPFTAARWPRWRPAGPPPSASPSSPCPPASSTCRATTSPRSRPRSARTPAPCSSSPSRARAACGRSTRAWLELARELCDRHGALLLYDEVQTGIGRCGALVLRRARRRQARCDRRRQGPRGRVADRCAARHGHAGRRLRAGRPRHDVRRARLRSRPPRSPCSTRSSARAWSRTRRAVGERISERAGAPAGRGSRAGSRAAARHRARRGPGAPRSRTALRARGILVNAITPTALRLVPPLCLSQGEADRFCATFEDVLAARLGQRATTVA